MRSPAVTQGRMGSVRHIYYAIVFSSVLCVSAFGAGQQYRFSTLGGGPPLGPVPAVSVSVGGTVGVAADAQGNFYFSSFFNCVFKVDSAGTLTMIAGSGIPGPIGSALSAQLNLPAGLAVDNEGNIYVAEFFGGSVKKISAQGTIATVAGGGSDGDGSPATEAFLSSPQTVALDRSGNLYIGERNALRKVSPNGIITTVLPGVSPAGLAVSMPPGPCTSPTSRPPASSS